MEFDVVQGPCRPCSAQRVRKRGALGPGRDDAQQRTGRSVRSGGARRSAWRAGRRVGSRLGVDLVRRHYYSPIPDLDTIPASHWDSPRPTPGITIDTDRHVQTLEQDLFPYLSEAGPALSRAGLQTASPTYGTLDTAVLYGMVRRTKPQRIVELGSGYSTLVIQAAASANEADGSPSTHQVFDPFPWHPALLGERVPGPAHRRHRGSEQCVHPAWRGRHPVRGHDPHRSSRGRRQPDRARGVAATPTGVLVHFHDILLPWDYPREWIEEAEYYWAEQYLLQAFLALNDRFEVVFAANAVARSQRERVAELVRPATPDETASAFWLRRTR